MSLEKNIRVLFGQKWPLVSCVSKCWAVSKLYRNVTFCISDSQLLLHVRCFTPNCSLDLGFVWWAFFSVSVQSFLTVLTSSFLFQTHMCRNSHNISNLYIYLHLYYLKKKKNGVHVAFELISCVCRLAVLALLLNVNTPVWAVLVLGIFPPHGLKLFSFRSCLSRRYSKFFPRLTFDSAACWGFNH